MIKPDPDSVESSTEISPDSEGYEDSQSPPDRSSISAKSPESENISAESSTSRRAPLSSVNLTDRPMMKFKSWRHPNPSAEPLYATVEKNVFLHLQSNPIINYTNAPLKEITFGKPMPPPDDLEITPDDSKYLTYFVTEVPDILGSDRFFPSAINSIFKQSVNEPVLRHSILAVSSWMTDNRQGRLPLYTIRHLERILPGIQKAIHELNITTAHILSVSFLSWLALMTGDLCTTHRHLKGLFLMYLETRHLNILGEAYHNPDPLIMFLYRMSIKIDNTLAYRNYPLAYPVMTNQELSHRQWLAHYLSQETAIEQCLATFRLDDFTNQICHLHLHARQLRDQKESNESQIHDRAKTIAFELNAWLNLSVVRPHIPAVSVETGLPVVSHHESSMREDVQFLHFPPYRIKDAMFGQMMMIHASLGIHLSIIVTGKLGSYPRTRYEYAVEVCRIYAALRSSSQSTIEKTGQSRMINSLWLAGLVLGRDTYPAGTAHENVYLR